MEESKITRLKEIGFTNDVSKVATVLRCRAYHNRMGSVTDTTYAAFAVDDLISPEDDKDDFREKIFELLKVGYPHFNDRDPYHPGGDYRFNWLYDDHNKKTIMQLGFGGALEEKDIVNRVIGILDTILKYDIKNADKYEEPKRQKVIKIIHYIEMMKIFIEDGSYSYEYHLESYNPLD